MPRPSEQLCKICLEPDISTEMISPCRCVGSVEFVHEQCLKVWILGRKGGPQEAECELCHTRYTMYCRYSVQCYRDWIYSPHKSRLIIVPISIAIIVMLSGMLYVISRSFNDLPSRQAKIFSISLMSFCSIAASFVMVLVVLTVRRICCVNKLTKWIIFNYERLPPGADETGMLNVKDSQAGIGIEESTNIIGPIHPLEPDQFVEEVIAHVEHLQGERKSLVPRVSSPRIRRSRSTENIL